MDRFTIVGIGPGTDEYLLPAAKKAIKEADTLAGAARHLAPYMKTGKKTLSLDEGLDDMLDAIAARKSSEKIALLLSGDPCIYSLLGKVAARFPSGEYKVLPGVSSVQLLFSRLGYPWNDTEIASLHGRPLDDAVHLVREGHQTVLFLDAKNSGPAVAAFLREKGFPDRPLWLAERLGYINERMTRTSLFRLAEEKNTEGLALLLLDPGPPHPLSKGMLPDEWFLRAEGVPLSKMPSRSLAVSLLLPLDGLSVLEVGAGSGGITVELARRIGKGTVFAVERSKDALAVAEKNLRRASAASSVRLVKGNAPEALKNLPQVNRAVVEGHGGSVETILEGAWEKLLPGGRILVTANMPATADRAWRKLKELGTPPSLMHVNASSAKDAGDSWMLAATNPVFLIYADKDGMSHGTM